MIKSVWLKDGSALNIDGWIVSRIICENGEWHRASFEFSEQNMRWERIS